MASNSADPDLVDRHPKPNENDGEGSQTLQAIYNDEKTTNSETSSTSSDVESAPRSQASKVAQPLRPRIGGNKDLTHELLKDLISRIDEIKRETVVPSPVVQVESVETTQNAYSYMFETRAEVRDCNWDQFKNHYSPEDEKFAIEVLISNDGLDAEMAEDQLRRLPPVKREQIYQSTERKYLWVNQQPEAARIERIRVNSAVILDALSGAFEFTWENKPHTFLRPFKTLIYHHKKIRDQLQSMKDRFEAIPAAASQTGGLGDEAERVVSQSSNDATLPVEGIKTQFENTAKPQVGDGVPRESDNKNQELKDSTLQNAFNSVKGYKELQCYVDFVNQRLLPSYHMFDEANHTQQGKVCYHELWSLFRMGELVYEPGESQDLKNKTSAGGSVNLRSAVREPRLLRVAFISEDVPDWVVDDLNNGGKIRQDCQDRDIPEQFTILAYYLDYDGYKYGPKVQRFPIDYFQGKRSITALPIYPIRFVKDYESLQNSLHSRGEKFQQLVLRSTTTSAYEGWTMTKDNEGRVIADPEYFDSDIIIDFREALRWHPPWKQEFGYLAPEPYIMTLLPDKLPILQWSDKDRSRFVGKKEEVVVEDDMVDELQFQELAKTDRFIVESEESADDIEDNGQILTPEDLMLLPPRLFAYSLKDRKFFQADIRNTKEIPPLLNPLENLKIRKHYKSLIKAVIHQHLEMKKIQREAMSSDRTTTNQDIIRNKGKGLVILLHGAPGVGKTATAEALAHSYQKPLFPITCGDLGIEAREVERNLSIIFRFANLWDCILLLDEAEIFLSQREKKDDNLQRNALVSVFLRTLEYYSGILFLTTNRAGVLDEALKSRVHISLHYPQLGPKETIEIVEMNLERLEAIEKERTVISKKPAMIIKKQDILDFAQEHYYNNADPDARWNGRQIRNACQIAASIAHYEHLENPRVRGPQLDSSHFKQVEAMTLEYDSYRKNLMGATDTELARKREERWASSDHDPSSSTYATQQTPDWSSARGGPPTRRQQQGSGPPQFRLSPSHKRHFSYQGEPIEGSVPPATRQDYNRAQTEPLSDAHMSRLPRNRHGPQFQQSMESSPARPRHLSHDVDEEYSREGSGYSSHGGDRAVTPTSGPARRRGGREVIGDTAEDEGEFAEGEEEYYDHPHSTKSYNTRSR